MRRSLDEAGVSTTRLIGSNILDDDETGRMIAIQIKDGDGFFEGKETDDGLRINAALAHLDYWLGHGASASRYRRTYALQNQVVGFVRAWR